MIRVLVVNEIRLTCNVIAAVLEEEPDIDVIGLATTVEEALDQISRCDVVLVSTGLPDGAALELTQAITETKSSVKVLALGLAESEAEILHYVETGADGYVLKDDSIDELLRQTRAVQDGEALVSPDIAAALMSRVAELAQFADTKEGDRVTDLTPREREVLELIGQDFSNQEIADHLVIEVGTVKNHVHSILQKLNVNSRLDAANYLALIEEHDNRS